MGRFLSSLAVGYLMTRRVGLAVLTRAGIAQSERQDIKHIAEDFMRKFDAPALSVAVG